MFYGTSKHCFFQSYSEIKDSAFVIGVELENIVLACQCIECNTFIMLCLCNYIVNKLGS